MFYWEVSCFFLCGQEKMVWCFGGLRKQLLERKTESGREHTAAGVQLATRTVILVFFWGGGAWSVMLIWRAGGVGVWYPRALVGLSSESLRSFPAVVSYAIIHSKLGTRVVCVHLRR